MSGPYQRRDLSNCGAGRLRVAINCGVLSVKQVAGVQREPTPIPPELGLDLTELDKVTARLMRKGIANSTYRAYRSAQNRFVKFCTEAGLTPVPATEQVLCWFISNLKQD